MTFACLPNDGSISSIDNINWSMWLRTVSSARPLLAMADMVQYGVTSKLPSSAPLPAHQCIPVQVSLDELNPQQSISREFIHLL